MTFPIQGGALLTEEQRRLLNSALAYAGLTHKQFCTRNGLSFSVFRQALYGQCIVKGKYVTAVNRIVKQQAHAMYQAVGQAA